MKKFSVFIMISLFLLLFISIDCYAMSRSGMAFGSRIEINFYDGIFENQSAKIVVRTDGRSTTNFAINVYVDDPNGNKKNTDIGWGRPGERNEYDVPLILLTYDGRIEPGTGYIRIVAGGQKELCYVPFSFDGRYINFGREFRPRQGIQKSPSYNEPSPPPPRDDVSRVKLAIRTIPEDAQVRMRIEGQPMWSIMSQRAKGRVTIFLATPDSIVDIEVSSPGYKTFTWNGPMSLLGCEEDGTPGQVEFNLDSQTWENY